MRLARDEGHEGELLERVAAARERRPSPCTGYFESIVTGKTMWSAIITETKPSASPRATSVSSASGVAVWPRVGR